MNTFILHKYRVGSEQYHDLLQYHFPSRIYVEVAYVGVREKNPHTDLPLRGHASFSSRIYVEVAYVGVREKNPHSDHFAGTRAQLYGGGLLPPGKADGPKPPTTLNPNET